MPTQNIAIRDKRLHIASIVIERRDVVDFFNSVPEGEREARFVHAIELGVFCLQRTTLHLDSDFLKRQIEGLLDAVEKRLSVLPKATQEELVKKIGTRDGQVLAPIQQHVDDAVALSVKAVKETRRLLDERLDPDSRRSTLGKALQQVQQMLNPKNDDSVQSRLVEAVSDMTRHDGALVKTVKKVLKDVTDPLKIEVERLATEVRAEEKAESIRQQTTLKGEKFELELVAELDSWKQITGAQVDYCGPDKRPGDILVTFAEGTALERSFSIVVEAKADADETGRKKVKDSLDRAMTRRRAESAVYVTETRGGLAQEIGEWCEGVSAHGPFIACTREHLITALRFLIVQRRIQEIRAILPAVDAATILTEIDRIRTALRKITAIKKQVTAVLESAETIRTEAEALRDEIQAALGSIESSIRLANQKEPQSLKKMAASARA